jgi:beta-glucanase (GH16 family)
MSLRRTISFSLGVLLSLAVLPVGSTALGETSTHKAVPKDRVLWSQQFTGKAGTRIDTKTWTYDLGNGFGWGNGEREYYTNLSSNISMDGTGKLGITARPLSWDNNNHVKMLRSCNDCAYSSAKIVTRDKVGFKYGRIEARMKTPAGVGMWPAFWMLGVSRSTCNGWPSCGEIDIMEARGAEVYRSVSSLHGEGYSGGEAIVHSYFSGSTPMTDAFHTYRVDWLPNRICFYVDNELLDGCDTASSVQPNSWAFNAEFYMILNLATGGQFDGGRLDETIPKAEMKIDWIKYSTLQGKGQLIKH